MEQKKKEFTCLIEVNIKGCVKVNKIMEDGVWRVSAPSIQRARRNK